VVPGVTGGVVLVVAVGVGLLIVKGSGDKPSNSCSNKFLPASAAFFFCAGVISSN
jgi:hypothetical protein